MQRSEFMTKFQLNNLPAQRQIFPNDKMHRQAAVLLPLLPVNNNLQLLFTKRPMHMKSHPGQVSFPGGKSENEDKSLIATALREAHEEIGLAPNNVDVIGQFPTMNTISGFKVTPVIGFIKQPFEIILDPNEVDSYFLVPLHYLMQRHNRQQIDFKFRKYPQTLTFIPYQDHLIWGITGELVERLCQQLK
ncbi:CoA pyrophosphatase [Shewanella marina]|uniref:CoA pyrophosphatase n=1 Tax=Shewanella marina TaxID=487319 RepID=UPI00046EADC5|nr:CoA pyrophosphatase [Shewanella marina]